MILVHQVSVGIAYVIVFCAPNSPWAVPFMLSHLRVINSLVQMAALLNITVCPPPAKDAMSCCRGKNDVRNHLRVRRRHYQYWTDRPVTRESPQ